MATGKGLEKKFDFTKYQSKFITLKKENFFKNTIVYFNPVKKSVWVVNKSSKDCKKKGIKKMSRASSLHI